MGEGGGVNAQHNTTNHVGVGDLRNLSPLCFPLRVIEQSPFFLKKSHEFGIRGLIGLESKFANKVRRKRSLQLIFIFCFKYPCYTHTHTKESTNYQSNSRIKNTRWTRDRDSNVTCRQQTL